MAGSDTEVDLSREVGEVIRAWRLAQDLTGERLAEMAGTTKAYISLLETGRIRRPGKDRLAAIAAALGLPVATLLTLRMPGEIDAPLLLPEPPFGGGLNFPDESSRDESFEDTLAALGEVRRYLDALPDTEAKRREVEMLRSFLEWRRFVIWRR